MSRYVLRLLFLTFGVCRPVVHAEDAAVAQDVPELQVLTNFPGTQQPASQGVAAANETGL